MLDPETCYRAMMARDARFDGCFYVAVSSTRIYCRPVCRVKQPKRENCTFYASAAAAEAAGYRPCLRCRPELAPGNALVDAGHRIAQSAAQLLTDDWLHEAGIEGVAARLGITARHLRRVFQDEFGVSPIAFAQTHRLLLAKQLLTDTSLPITDIAFTSGFASLRRFHAVFQERYRLSPKQLRKKPGREPQSDVQCFNLSYRPPYDWEALLAFLGARCIPDVEAVEGLSYRRIVCLSKGGQAHYGWVEMLPQSQQRTVRVTLSASLAKVIPAVLARVRHLLDLSCDPTRIGEVLGDLAAARPGLRVPGAFDGFEVAVRAVLGQQVSVAAAQTLAGRFAKAFGTPVESPFAALSTAFPSAEQIAPCSVEQVAALGILPARAHTILALAQALQHKTLVLTPGVNVEATLEQLQAIRGIGPWTAHYIAMRALAWPDAFPHTDLGLMKSLREKNPKRVLAAGDAWRPWRAYAVMHLWSAGVTDELVA